MIEKSKTDVANTLTHTQVYNIYRYRINTDHASSKIELTNNTPTDWINAQKSSNYVKIVKLNVNEMGASFHAVNRIGSHIITWNI